MRNNCLVPDRHHQSYIPPAVLTASFKAVKNAALGYTFLVQTFRRTLFVCLVFLQICRKLEMCIRSLNLLLHKLKRIRSYPTIVTLFVFSRREIVRRNC